MPAPIPALLLRPPVSREAVVAWYRGEVARLAALLRGAESTPGAALPPARSPPRQLGDGDAGGTAAAALAAAVDGLTDALLGLAISSRCVFVVC